MTIQPARMPADIGALENSSLFRPSGGDRLVGIARAYET
jgi:hypothetical protein